MNSVVNLVPKHQRQSEGTVEALEKMLEMAKNGEINQVAIAATDKEGYSHSMYSAGENFGLLIGACERLKYRLLVAQDAL